MMVDHTDGGKDLHTDISDLYRLLEMYRSGAITPPKS